MSSLIKLISVSVEKLHDKNNVHSPIAVWKRKKNLARKRKSLPDQIWEKIFDECSPFEVLVWRRVCKQFNEIISGRISRLLYLEVYRFHSRMLREMPRLCDGQGSFFGAKNSNITIRMDRHNVVLVAPECWCPTDIIQLFRAISIFGISAHTVCMDASIFEMITAGISTILIQDRFSLRDEFMNRLRFLPNLRELTLNVPLKELRCLSRISGYGLCPERIFERRALSICRLCLPSTNRPSPASEKNKISNRSINGHVNTFKRWIDATSLKERYCQHYY